MTRRGAPAALRMGAAVTIGAALLSGCAGEPPAPRVEGALRGSWPEGALTVLTYNVSFEQPSDATVEAIRLADADLVFLQETHAHWLGRLEAGVGPAVYPHRLSRHAPREGGLTILSRYPLEDVQHGVAASGLFPAWCVRAETPRGTLDILHVHLHPPLAHDSLVLGYLTTGGARLEELREHLRCFGRTPDLVVGDFNEETGEAVRHLEGLGLRQAQVVLGPPERTWSWDTGRGELEGQPDHLFFGPALRLAGVQVMQQGGSDHRPLRAAFVAPLRTSAH